MTGLNGPPNCGRSFAIMRVMTNTFFFYDLETSGLDPRNDRIMQFAGQRTDMDLNPIGESYNVLVKLNDDTLPSPEAVMVTGITPQSTHADGYTEADFARFLKTEIFTADTITVGFNNVRFDDEFIRALFWRTFNDPYDWCWDNGCSRWDMLDVIRMTRALRPEGLEWPVDDEGRAVNKLERITAANGIEHVNAHDALADVEALIAVTRLVKDAQPKLYEYLLSVRSKKRVQELVNLTDKKPFVYVSGRYDASYNKATVAVPLATGPNQNVIVYDLRHDPSQFIGLSESELKSRLFASWEDRKKDGYVAIPVKQLQYNRCPAVAPLGVLAQADGWQKLTLEEATIKKHMTILFSEPTFAERIRTIVENKPAYARSNDVEARLYDGFIQGADKARIEAVRNADAKGLADFNPMFDDDRLADLLLRYKARNYPMTLTESEAVTWEQWRAARVEAGLQKYGISLGVLAKEHAGDDNKQFLLQELQLWAESIMPSDFGDE